MALVVDPRMAGISGDMMLAALVDMGADGDALVSLAEECSRLLPGSSVKSMEFKREVRGGIRCTRLALETEDPPSRPALEVSEAVRKSARRMNLSEGAAEFAIRSVSFMVDAECRVHGAAPDSVHLHEASSLDTLIDIVGTAAALDGLRAFGDAVYVTPVNVGDGAATFSHGTFPNPAPAALEMLRAAGIPMEGGGAGTETATPTGICMLAGLRASPTRHYPAITASRVGYGAGSRDPPGRANVLTIVQGSGDGSGRDTVDVLEANIDDATGEMLGGAISAVMENGALDATVHAGTGKKGRPVNAMSVLCAPRNTQNLIREIMRHTGTLGVRVTTARRHTLDREVRTAAVPLGGATHTVRYKVRSHLDARDLKIEFDDIARVARETGMAPARAERVLRRAIEDGPQ